MERSRRSREAILSALLPFLVATSAPAAWADECVPGPLDFNAAMSLEPGEEPRSLTIGDFNLDGIPDLAVAVSDENRVAVFRGEGGGTFRSMAINTAINISASIAPREYVNMMATNSTKVE